MDYGTAILTGLFTGIGVILAQWFMRWVENHPVFHALKRQAKRYTIDEWEEIYRRRKH